MKQGDIVKYKYPTAVAFQRYPLYERSAGMILYVNEKGGTLKVVDLNGEIQWFVTSYCEVVSEDR